MEALYELVALVDESADQLDDLKASFERRMLLAHPSLREPGVLHDRLKAAIEDAVERASADLEEPDGEASGSDSSKGEADDAPRAIGLDLSKLFSEYGGDTVRDALRALSRQRRPRATVAFNSLLVAAVGEFEAMCSKCIQGFITKYPGKLSRSERTFTFAEVAAFDELEEFKSRAADMYAENIMRGSVDDWLKWFATDIKLDGNDITQDWGQFVEIFQRRHLLVHNGGVVNHVYRSKVTKMPADLLPRVQGLETRADVGRAYLQDAIAQLQAAGLLLAVHTAMRIKPPSLPERHPADTLIADASFEFLRDGRGRELTLFSERVLAVCGEEAIRLLVRVNLWIHRKQVGGADVIREEVSSWDVRHCSERFQIAKPALLDQHEETWGLAQRLLKGGELEMAEWESWPLFAETRRWRQAEFDSVKSSDTGLPGPVEGDESSGSSIGQ